MKKQMKRFEIYLTYLINKKNLTMAVNFIKRKNKP